MKSSTCCHKFHCPRLVHISEQSAHREETERKPGLSAFAQPMHCSWGAMLLPYPSPCGRQELSAGLLCSSSRAGDGKRRKFHFVVQLECFVCLFFRSSVHLPIHKYNRERMERMSNARSGLFAWGMDSVMLLFCRIVRRGICRCKMVKISRALYVESL